MKKSFLKRVQAIESQAVKRQNMLEPVIYFDGELSVAMHIIGNGLVIPAPMTIEEWEMLHGASKQWQQLSND